MTAVINDTRTDAEPAAHTRPSTHVPWNVVLLDDNHHTYDYVIDMMRRVFRHSSDAALRIARDVDTHKRAVCLTTHKELAELKRDQILAFGTDPRIAACAGSMTAVIEPAHQHDDNDEHA